MIDINQNDLDMVKEILLKHFPKSRVIVFGSRINGTAQKFSDLDLAIDNGTKIDWQKLERVKDDLSESDLPISVDVLDWHNISIEFQKIIENKHEILVLN